MFFTAIGLYFFLTPSPPLVLTRQVLSCQSTQGSGCLVEQGGEQAYGMLLFHTGVPGLQPSNWYEWTWGTEKLISHPQVGF